MQDQQRATGATVPSGITQLNTTNLYRLEDLQFKFDPTTSSNATSIALIFCDTDDVVIKWRLLIC